MIKIVVCVTGSNGFIGKNLIARLKTLEFVEVRTIDRQTKSYDYIQLLENVDIVYHLAGVNRPGNDEEFNSQNVEFTKQLLDLVIFKERPVKFILASSSQAVLDNLYGRSKLAAELYLSEISKQNKVSAIIYRLPGIFGKWSKPNYNSVVSTFCYNVAHDLPVEINNPDFMITLVYIDDVIDSFVGNLTEYANFPEVVFRNIEVQFTITLRELANKILEFKQMPKNYFIPETNDRLAKCLYSTYLSYLPKESFIYPLQLREDERGFLFEWIKSKSFGQIFVSKTKPGITRGNHYHNTKTEKFLVIQGVAEIKFRKIYCEEIIVYRVYGEKPMVVDIPPGYTHNITNIGSEELITLFWANEIFDSNKPDTFFLEV